MNQKTAIETLQECNSDEEAKRLFEEHPKTSQFVTLHNSQGAFINACPFYLEHTGYELNDLEGESAYSFFHGDDLQDILKSHASITLKPEVSEVAYRFRKKDGMFTLFRSYSKQIHSDNGNGIIVVITEPLEG